MKILPNSFSTISFVSILLLLSFSSVAEWEVITHTNTNNETQTQVAFNENKSGYTLEIYKDSVEAIRLRFSLKTKFDVFSKEICPSYQIDTNIILYIINN